MDGHHGKAHPSSSTCPGGRKPRCCRKRLQSRYHSGAFKRALRTWCFCRFTAFRVKSSLEPEKSLEPWTLKAHRSCLTGLVSPASQRFLGHEAYSHESKSSRRTSPSSLAQHTSEGLEAQKWALFRATIDSEVSQAQLLLFNVFICFEADFN